jgi:soluble lytic murein transglycosylase-like protein
MMKKFLVIVLFLGCTAIASLLAVPSEFGFKPSTFAQFPQVPLTLARWFGFPHAMPSAVTAPVTAAWTAAPAVPLLSKAEALLLIAGAAARHRVPAAFVASIVAAESNFKSTAVSPKGAIGLMQLMPNTARQFGADPAVPAQNVDAGTRYLRWLMARYQHRRNSIRHVIAAYNAGPGMVDRYRGVPPFRETRRYVTRVLGHLKQFSLSDRRRHVAPESVIAEAK